MNKLNLEGPINSLSLGNVTVNFIRELFNKNINLNIFPVAERAEFGAYDKLDENVRQGVINSGGRRFIDYNVNDPVLKIWHINGSQFRAAKNQYLYTFYETDSPTEHEVGIVKAQNHVFMPSTESVELFKAAGCHNVSQVPLGFDRDFLSVPERKLDGIIHFGLIGKFESRKNTREIIKAWTELFGDNPKYQLTLLVGNPFFSEEDFNSIMNESLGRRWSNINVLPRLETNSQVAMLHRSIDIDLSGLNGNESWNLPAFNSACFGKVCVVGNANGHKDWAQGENILLVEPDGKRPCYDGVFFREGTMFSQGNFYKFEFDTIKKAIDDSLLLFKEVKNLGLREDMIEKFSYSNSIDTILNTIQTLENL